MGQRDFCHKKLPVESHEHFLDISAIRKKLAYILETTIKAYKNAIISRESEIFEKNWMKSESDDENPQAEHLI